MARLILGVQVFALAAEKLMDLVLERVKALVKVTELKLVMVSGSGLGWV
jgi:hypothetical protein